MARKRILLIDDDQVSLESLREVLEQAGHETMTTTDGRQGLALAQSQSPDLIVLDLLLPGLDGYQICEILKGDPRYAHIPILMLTGVFITSEDMQRGLQVGAERYLLKVDACVAKPPAYDQLLREVHVLLGQATALPTPEKNLVLVVDDDDLSREALKQTLSSEGYPVVTAADGKEGWARFQSSDPSLVLLDVHMPELDGLEVLQRIRDQTTDVAVMMMTAFGSEESAVQAMKQGADGYLVKPFQSWQIMPAVKENLEKTRLRRLNRQLMARLRDSNVCLVEKHRALQAQNAAMQEAYRCLQDAEQMWPNVVGMIVHDLKNPLNVMLISLDLLATDSGGVLIKEQREILRSANLAGQQMRHLISNLLEVQRLEDGKMPVRLQVVDLALTLRVTVRQAQPLADQKDTALLLQVADTLPRVLADVDLTPRIVANLLDNAIKFTPPNGQITVTAEPGEQEIVVCVADSGPGIPADQQTHIFEKFSQVAQGLRDGKASVGLGLAFCKLAVEAQGGHIWVESEPGQGSRFKFVLPIWRKDTGPGEVG